MEVDGYVYIFIFFVFIVSWNMFECLSPSSWLVDSHQLMPVTKHYRRLSLVWLFLYKTDSSQASAAGTLFWERGWGCGSSSPTHYVHSWHYILHFCCVCIIVMLYVRMFSYVWSNSCNNRSRIGQGSNYSTANFIRTAKERECLLTEYWCVCFMVCFCWN